MIERILNAEPEPRRESVTAEAWANLKKNLGAELRTANAEARFNATIEAMRKAGAPDADIEAFKAGMNADHPDRPLTQK